MHFEIVNTEKQLIALREEWNDLLSRSVSNVPFLRHEFLTTWWSTLGGGEWSSGDLRLVLGRGEAGDLQGIAPLFAAEGDASTLRFLGTVEIADYLDLIVTPDLLPEFVHLIGQALEGDWEELDLVNIPAVSPAVSAWQNWAEANGHACQSTTLQPCPAIALPESWQDYLARLEKKQRQELRRKIRNAQRAAGDLRLSLPSNQNQLEESLGEMLRLMRTDPRKAEFLSEAMQEQFITMALHAYEAGWLHLSLLRAGGKAISGLLSFDYEGRIWVYNSGFDHAYLDLSPGWVHMGMLIQWAIEHGRQAVDFLRGDEEYKFRLGGVAQAIKRVVITRAKDQASTGPAKPRQ